MHVRVLTGQPVTDVRADRVTVGSETIATATVIWAAGVKATPVATWLGVEGDRGGRIAVNSALQLPGEESIYVIGDVAAALATDGKPLPAVAPVAMQQGRFVARHIRERARGSRPREGFRYRDKGSLATIGRSKAVAAMGWLNMAGRIAWYLWLFVHIMYLVGFKNRLFVLMQWAWSYTTSQRGARLITHKH
jgi:NADH dehydrogenase